MSRLSESSPSLKPPLGPRDHLIGVETAKLVLCEYGDYQCPHCKRAQPIVKAILSSFGDDLLFGFRNFPLVKMHPFARAAAEAAEAAGAQNKFWEMHDLLFENQAALEFEDLVGYAGDIGLDIDRFRADIQAKTFAAKVQEDLSTGIRSGVNGTPTFFIQNHRFNGGYDLEELTQALKAV